MSRPRRQFLCLVAGAAAVPAFPRFASALNYPTRPVRFVVEFFAGSLSDIVARTIADGLSKQLGQQVVVDDQPGAGGNLATDIVVRARPDGYTLLEATSANVWNATLYDKLSFDFIRDIAPVANISRTPGVMAVTPSFPAKTVSEFIAYAKANPDQINMASGGIGSLPHVAGELFKFMTSVKLVHVPYRGSYLPDLLGGQVQVAFGPIPTLIEQIRAGKLRALAVTGASPSAALPNIPTVGEFVPGYEASAFSNSRPDDVLMAEQANFAFRQAGGSAAEFQAGLEYAVQNGWLEISENDTIKLTNAGFAEIKPDKNSN